MNGSAILIIASIIYSMCLFFVYRSKQHIDTVEHKIFSFLISLNFIGLINELLNYILVLNFKDSLITFIISKCYLWYLLTFIIIFTYYIIYISFSNRERMVKFIKNKLVNIMMGIYFICLLLVVFLPIHFCNTQGIYSYGASVNVIYVVSTICLLTGIICMFLNFKNILSKKYLPLLSFLSLGIVAMAIQKLYPSITLTTSVETFVVYMMYFTIENPDIKLIEQLNIARAKAEQANAAKTDFLSNMSHEIRTPLNAIMGFSNILLEDKKIPSSAKEEINDIVMASDNLLEIVNGILDISKIEANKLEIVNNEYDFTKLCQELISLTKGRLGEKPITLKTAIAPDIPKYLYGDSQRIKQVCINLLTNAVKYTKEGEITFQVDCIRKNDVCRLIIAVEDTGIGIKKDNINKLFNKFERLDLEENITIEGTGLGLAITKKLLDLMNGKIVVQSVYGKGSKFTVSIDQKIVEGTPKQEEVKKSKPKKITKKGRILVVDDNLINLKVAEKLLESYHLQIDSVTSGDECLKLLRSKKKYDLILLDDMMPKLSGTETLKIIRKEFKDLKTPVVMLTANALTGMKEKYLNLGFKDYLAKPIDKQELDRIIKTYL